MRLGLRWKEGRLFESNHPTAGWTAGYDRATGMWYYIDHNATPPTSTWQDPRCLLAPPPAPLHPPCISPVQCREDADWLARRFAALEASRQYEEGRRGPVAAEIGRERKEYKELLQATLATEKAAKEAGRAAAQNDSESFHAAQQAMVKARGVLDRLSHDARLRSAAMPPSMHAYQGVTRGYDFDPAYLRPRTYYSDTAPPPAVPYNSMEGMATTSFRGRVMGKLSKPTVPGGSYMPTAYPLPPGVKYRASTTPTPYAMPEFCFAWDMLLRSQRDPVLRFQ